jgi:hypothetical protein
MKVTRRFTIGAVAAVLVGSGLAATGIVAVATATPSPTYTACLTTLGGALYNVTTNGTPKCLGKDKTITWSQTGPQGAAGANGASVVTSTGVPSGMCTTGNTDIDVANGDVYTCAASAWGSSVGSIEGPEGPAGSGGGTQCAVTDETTPFTPTATLTDLQTAINDATSGDTLDITGECIGNFTINNGTLTLMGIPSAELNADGSGTVLTVASGAVVTLADLLITGGNSASSTSGGGVYNDGTLTLNGDSQVDNNTGFVGAGINNDGTLTLNGDSQVDNNLSPPTLGAGGGGIFNEGTLTLNGSSQVDGNNTGYGGGIVDYSGTLTLNGSSQVDNNTASTQGGGIYDAIGTVILNNASQVDNNNASVSGGGVAGSGGSAFTLNNDSQVDYNTVPAGDSGGGINSGGTLNGAVSGTNVTGNSPDNID